jgi:hypothetical protein
MKKDYAIHRWEQRKKEELMDSILEEVLKIDCSKDDAIAIISTELDKRGIYNVDWEDEILKNWEDAQTTTFYF